MSRPIDVMHRRRHAPWATVVLAALIAACGGDYDGGDPVSGPTPPPPAPGQTNTVKLVTSGGARFEPANIEVPVGTTVTFVWEEGLHDVTSAGSPGFQGSGDPVSPPKSLPVRFTEAGTYTFFCSVHGSPTSGMRGTVTVR